MNLIVDNYLKKTYPFFHVLFLFGNKWAKDSKYLFLIGLYLFYRFSIFLYHLTPFIGALLFIIEIIALFIFFTPKIQYIFQSYFDDEVSSKAIGGIPLNSFSVYIFFLSLVLLLVNIILQVNLIFLFAAWLIFCIPLICDTWIVKHTPVLFVRLQVFSIVLIVIGFLCVIHEGLLGIFFIPFLTGVFGFHYFRDLFAGNINKPE